MGGIVVLNAGTVFTTLSHLSPRFEVKRPTGQSRQVAEPCARANLPCAHILHLLRLFSFANWPGAHLTHSRMPVPAATLPLPHALHAPAPKFSINLPTGHLRHAARPTPENLPGWHSKHLCIATAAAMLPFPHVVHEPAPYPGMNLPRGHFRHIVPPPTLVKWPGVQGSHSVVSAELANFPLGHAVQPELPANFPARHPEQVVLAAAEKKPGSHPWQSGCPLAAYLPPGQSAQRVAPASGAKRPPMQCTHFAAFANIPAAHLMQLSFFLPGTAPVAHALQLMAPLMAEYLPSVHTMHLLPDFALKRPAVQGLQRNDPGSAVAPISHARHAVAPSIACLPS